MALDWVGQGFVALTLLGCVVLVFITVGLVCLLGLHLFLRRDRLAAEAKALGRPLPSDTELPHVVVQIPVYNEGALVERAVACAARLDWPRDKLHIQVCDNSSDDTTEIALAAAQRARNAGVDVVVLSRPDRTEFKAGNLKNGMAKTDHDYFAVFDVDYVPASDFLRKCMTVLLADTKLGFVQARLDFLNPDENVLTRTQTMLLDYHCGFEQATRSWANHLLPFNGTCGIWRRAAIEAAGGWQGDTVLEDWDLSHRAWLEGWRGTFITSLAAAGELPGEWSAWMLQQNRWGAGGGQVALKMLPIFGAKKLSFRKDWSALMPLGSWLAYSLFSATLIVAIPAMLLSPSWGLAITLDAVFSTAAVVLFTGMVVANRTVGRNTSLKRLALDGPVALLLALYISWANLRSIPKTILGRPRTFARTPKRGFPIHTPAENYEMIGAPARAERITQY